MPALEESSFVHTAVLWPAVGTDRYGQATLGPPEEHPCRWVSRVSAPRDPKRFPMQVDATVELAVDVTQGSVMWKGSLSALVGTAIPADAMVVVGFNATDDARGRETFREASLSRVR